MDTSKESWARSLLCTHLIATFLMLHQMLEERVGSPLSYNSEAGLALFPPVFLQKSSHESKLCLVEHYGSCWGRFLPRALRHQHICLREDCSLALELVPCLPSGEYYQARLPVRWLTSTTSPLYNSELAPPEVRGFLIALQQLTTTIGIMLAYWTGVCQFVLQITREQKHLLCSSTVQTTSAGLVKANQAWLGELL